MGAPQSNCGADTDLASDPTDQDRHK